MRIPNIVSLSLLLLIFSTGWIFSFAISPNHSTNSRINNLSSSSGTASINSINGGYSSASSSNARESHKESSSDVQLPHNSLNAIKQPLAPTRLFWVRDLINEDNEDVFYEINATLRKEGTNALYYSDITLTTFPMAIIDDMNDSFEMTIFPKLTSFFGPFSDVDNNSKVIILIFDIIDNYSPGYVAGYFDAYHQQETGALYPKSNHAEILHIDGVQGQSQFAKPKSNFDVIAHELQHMIHYENDWDEELWLDEGASMFAEHLIGRNPFASGPYKGDFTSNPDVSLTYWDYNNEKSLIFANYGATFAFFLYLAEQYGGATIIQDISLLSTNGIMSMEEALLDQGYSVSFSEVFRNWTIANLLDNTSLGNGAYGYTDIDLEMDTEGPYTSTMPISRTERAVPFWGTNYLRFNHDPNIPFELEFKGTDNAGYLVTVILENTSSPESTSEVFYLTIAPDGTGSFSADSFNLSADKITLIVSSYTKSGTPNHDDYNPAPEQRYWFMINPKGIFISLGNFSVFSQEGLLDIWNVTATDNNGFEWSSADGATFEIVNSSGISAGISGNLTYNSAKAFWEVQDVNITGLVAGDYKIKYYFYNATSSGIGYSQIFTLVNTTSSSSSTTTTTVAGISMPGFLLTLAFIAIALRKVSNKREKA